MIGNERSAEARGKTIREEPEITLSKLPLGFLFLQRGLHFLAYAFLPLKDCSSRFLRDIRFHE